MHKDNTVTKKYYALLCSLEELGIERIKIKERRDTQGGYSHQKMILSLFRRTWMAGKEGKKENDATLLKKTWNRKE